jgi:hypothetical protein
LSLSKAWAKIHPAFAPWPLRSIVLSFVPRNLTQNCVKMWFNYYALAWDTLLNTYSNPGRLGGKPATSCLSCGTACVHVSGRERFACNIRFDHSPSAAPRPEWQGECDLWCAECTRLAFTYLNQLHEHQSRDRRATGLDDRGAEVRVLVWQRIFTSPYRPDPTSYRMATGAFSPGVKRPGREADHSPPTSGEVEETPIRLYDVVLDYE